MQSWFTINGSLGAITFLAFAVYGFKRLNGRSERLPFTLLCLGLASAFLFRAIRAATHSVFANGLIWVSFLGVFICLVWSAIVMQDNRR